MSDPPEIKLLLLGDAEIGKSTFVSRISNGPSSSKTRTALLRDIDQPFIFDIHLSNGPFRLLFYDTASPEAWRTLEPDVVVLCYDISSRLSLIDIQRFWLKDIHTAFAYRTDLPVLLLGLKRDLRSETDPNGIIYPQEAYRIAQEMRCDKYMECSAVTGELVQEVFEDICKVAVQTRTAKGGLSDGGCGIL